MARDRPSPYGKSGRSGYRSAGACPPRSPASRCRLRSFRTYMSIEKRAVTFSRSFRSLIKTRADLAKPIKDLKDLRVLRNLTCYRHSGPTDLKRTRDVFSLARTMARDRPSPYGKSDRSGYRSAGACPPRSPASRCRLRSFRTYMSIETRAGPMSRSFRSLIKTRADLAKPIKDLKDLRVLHNLTCYRH